MTVWDKLNTIQGVVLRDKFTDYPLTLLEDHEIWPVNALEVEYEIVTINGGILRITDDGTAVEQTAHTGNNGTYAQVLLTQDQFIASLHVKDNSAASAGVAPAIGIRNQTLEAVINGITKQLRVFGTDAGIIEIPVSFPEGESGTLAVEADGNDFVVYWKLDSGAEYSVAVTCSANSSDLRVGFRHHRTKASGVVDEFRVYYPAGI